MRLVNEPTRLLWLGLDQKQNGIVAVYTWVAALSIFRFLSCTTGFRMMATNGDTHLGGDDIDNLLITIALDDIQGDLVWMFAAMVRLCRPSARR